MNYLGTATFIVVSLGVGACGASADTPDDTREASTCTPGEQLPCACSDGASAVQVCAADGSSLGACACGSSAPGGDEAAPPTTTEPDPLPSDPAGPTEPTVTDPSDPSPTEPGQPSSDPLDPAEPPSDPTEPTEPAADPVEPVDPNAPVVQVPGIACGSPLDSTTLLPPIIELGGRQVFIDYACDKPEGTPVTFILNLHGTMDLEEGKIYQRGYLPAYNYTASHDFVIATPKAITSQWGNGDGGQDLPHLLETIEWVYSSFAGFDIQQMWVVGHSWGAMYARDFVCRPDLADRISGVVLMSGGSGAPACADRLSIIGTVGETDIVPGEVNQTAAAAAHGCGPAETYMIGNTNVTNFPNCSPGWIHRNYFMLGKGHGFDPSDWPETVMTDDLVDAIRATR